MKKQDSVTYLAIFSKESDGGYSIDVPAIEGAYTCSDTFEEGIANAQEVIGLCLYDEENEKIEYPNDIDLSLIHISETMIDIDMDDYIRRTSAKTIKKTVTIPSYLNEMAKEYGVNFSRVLTEGLKKELNIK